ncbi:MAG TPA: hypothetical protein VF092_10215 [Longimicrobium sp.]
MAFLSTRGGNWQLHVMESDGSNPTRIGVIGGSPAWSPDGSKITFVDWWLDIYVINPDGTGLVNVTNSPAYEIEPSWSPDGTRILFRRNDSNGYRY